MERGAGELLLTSMDGDGTQGYDLELTAAIADAVPVPVMPGGAGCLDHIAEVLSPQVLQPLSGIALVRRCAHGCADQGRFAAPRCACAAAGTGSSSLSCL